MTQDSSHPFQVTSTEQAEDIVARIGAMARMLRDGMRELGLDRAIAEVADAIPDARDRLRYVANMTEQAANRVLNATEAAQPFQEQMEREAKSLDQRWQEWFAEPIELEQARELVDDTRSYLRTVPENTQATNAQLMEIMMAQDFQDLTGQVIMKMMDIISAIETELLQVLLDTVQPERRDEAETLLNGPQVKPDGKADVVTDQSQVDDLLSSLGF